MAINLKWTKDDNNPYFVLVPVGWNWSCFVYPRVLGVLGNVIRSGLVSPGEGRKFLVSSRKLNCLDMLCCLLGIGGTESPMKMYKEFIKTFLKDWLKIILIKSFIKPNLMWLKPFLMDFCGWNRNDCNCGSMSHDVWYWQGVYRKLCASRWPVYKGLRLSYFNSGVMWSSSCCYVCCVCACLICTHTTFLCTPTSGAGEDLILYVGGSGGVFLPGRCMGGGLGRAMRD